MKSSTFRSAIQSTIGESLDVPRSLSLRQVIRSEWLQSGTANLVAALRRHPLLLRDRSLLLDLAIEEYRAHRQIPDGIDLERHCQRFEEFGSSIRRSILRQLEAQRYIDDHPELLEVLCSPKWPKAGENLGAFRVLEELGFGASSHVYLCLQQDVGNREVVVKATPFSSFEASILGRLSHPNIIPIYSAGSIDECNLNYLCMPFCGRSTLSDLLDVAFQDGVPRQGDAITRAARRWIVDEQLAGSKVARLLPNRFGHSTYVDSILALAVQIADALEHAHSQRILHGDLKPSNVLLTPSAEPLLLDFNLSQDFANSPGMYGGGTLPYMAPEHLQLVAGRTRENESALFDPTSDVFSFGALLYELTSGVTPVTVPSHVDDLCVAAELVLAQLNRGLPPVRRYNPLVSKRLEMLILRCLAFKKAERPAGVAEVKQLLKAEIRSLAAVGRFARVRPYFCTAVVGMPLTLIAAAASHVALQPPRYLSTYERGLQSASIGEINDAIEHFAATLDAVPSYGPARFQLARAQISRGKVDLAIDNFAKVLDTDGEIRSLAYVGYCFNLKRLHIAAIPWYERAIRAGVVSAAVYNNLAASYLDASTQMNFADQLRLANDYLLKALELEPTSTTIQLNIVRHAAVRSKFDPHFDPTASWRHAKAILDAAPEDQLIRIHVARWYGAVASCQTPVGEKLRPPRDSILELNSSDREIFEQLYEDTSPTRDYESTASAQRYMDLSENGASSRVRRYYLEPLSFDDSRQ